MEDGSGQVKEKKARKKRDDRPIVAYETCGDADLCALRPVPGFPTNITRKEKAVAWAIKQAKANGTAMNILFFRDCGSFKAAPQTVMQFDVE